MSNPYKNFRNFIDNKIKPDEIIQSQNPNSNPNSNPNNEKTNNNLKKNEKKLDHLYVGCYIQPSNDIVKPSDEIKHLADVNNQLECIYEGQKKGYKFVALTNGNECLGINNFDFVKKNAVSRNKCNIVCNDTNAGFCGGINTNQIYATSLINKADLTKKIPHNNFTQDNYEILDNFSSYNKEMHSINKNINKADINCQKPINKYNLFLILIISILIGYILLEHILT